MSKRGHRVFIDTERDIHDNIIEIGIAIFNKETEELVDTFETKINHKKYIGWQVEKLTGIKMSSLKNAPDPSTAKQLINNFLFKNFGAGKVDCFAWGNDVVQINNFFNKQKTRKIKTKNCQKFLCKDVFEKENICVSLERMSDLLELPFDQEHRALSDAIQTGKVFFELTKRKRKFVTLSLIENEYWEKNVATSDIEQIEKMLFLTKKKNIKKGKYILSKHKKYNLNKILEMKNAFIDLEKEKVDEQELNHFLKMFLREIAKQNSCLRRELNESGMMKEEKIKLRYKIEKIGNRIYNFFESKVLLENDKNRKLFEEVNKLINEKNKIKLIYNEEVEEIQIKKFIASIKEVESAMEKIEASAYQKDNLKSGFEKLAQESLNDIEKIKEKNKISI